MTSFCRLFFFLCFALSLTTTLDATVEASTSPALTRVQLTGYAERGDAELHVRELAANGIDAYVMKARAETGYTISAGVFAVTLNARNMEQRLRGLGYENVIQAPVGAARAPTRPDPTPDTPRDEAPDNGVAHEIDGRDSPVPDDAAAGPTASDRTEPSPWGTEAVPTKASPPWKRERSDTALPIEMSGHFWTRYGHDLKEETPYEYDGTSHTEVRLKAAYRPGPDWYALLSVQADAFLYRNGGDWDDDISVKPHEAFVRYAGESWEVSLGNQIVKWGKADEVSLLDILNPDDLRGGFVRSREERKLPLPMLNLALFKDAQKLETIFIPFFRRSKIDLVGRDWALFTHYDREVGAFRIIETRPANDLSNSEFGLRFSGTVRNFDYALSLLHTREDLPSFDSLITPPGFRVPNPGDVSLRDIVMFASNPSAPQPIRLQYRRQNLLGFDFETTWKSLGLRGEVAYLRNRSFLDDRLRRVEAPVWSYVLGADYNRPGVFYCNLQFSQQILGRSANGLLLADRVTNIINGEINRKLFEDRMELAVRFLYNFTRKDYYVNPFARLKYWPGITVDIGIQRIGGPSNSTLGVFDNNDEAYLIFNYNF